MSYSYFLSAAETGCKNLKEFEPNIKLSNSIENILCKLKNKYPDVEWEDVGGGVMYGSARRKCDTEIWVFSRHPHRGIKVSGISYKEAVGLGRELLLAVFDMQTGERLN